MYLSAAILRAVVVEASRYGVTESEILHAAGVPASALEEPTSRVSLREAGFITDAAIRLSGRSDLGLRVGAITPTRALHVVGHVLISARTLREAIHLFFRYTPLVIEGATFELVEDDAFASMRYAYPSVRPLASEISLSFMYRIGMALVGADARAHVARFRHPAPDHADAYEQVFECPVEFEREHDELVFDASLLDVETPSADDRLSQLLIRRADELLVLLDSAVPIERRVREILANEPDLREVTMDVVAGRVRTGARSLRRKLQAAGLSWSELLDREQKSRAFVALETSSAPIKELAYQLGFSEPSAFHRAFKRWTGMTPIEYRRQHRETT